MTKQIFKKKFKKDFERKPFGNKSKFLMDAKAKMLADLAIETNIVKSEITKE